MFRKYFFPHTVVWMLWVSRPWMAASEFLWNKYETPTPRYSSAWWWNMSERHSFRGCYLVKICILSGAPRTVFSWWFSLCLLPFELSLSWANVRECLMFSGHFHSPSDEWNYSVCSSSLGRDLLDYHWPGLQMSRDTDC